MASELTLPPEYPALLADLKARVRAAQHRAHRVVNKEMLTLYWQIGDAIRTRQAMDGWGTKVVDRLAADLRAEFRGMKGLSRSNLNYMLAFAIAWPAEAIVQRPAGKLGWGHLMLLIDKLDDPAARDWYAAAADPDVHRPTFGLLMCSDRNETVVRYSLGATTSPVAVSTYTYDALPPEEQAALPSEADVVHALASATATVRASWAPAHHS